MQITKIRTILSNLNHECTSNFPSEITERDVPDYDEECGENTERKYWSPDVASVMSKYQERPVVSDPINSPSTTINSEVGPSSHMCVWTYVWYSNESICVHA